MKEFDLNDRRLNPILGESVQSQRDAMGNTTYAHYNCGKTLLDEFASKRSQNYNHPITGKEVEMMFDDAVLMLKERAKRLKLIEE